ncbi:EcsC family protein [Cellulomonas fimi]|uniref:EcsC family protein n=1 Tax=Cellulomonas fimi (strain ATCC 484 / DSM 20113 / JCM 1341 / CCUG 24087 / LMG 16345 / NBRC 15513 / NCIMB 8980 / NCTC 7547 / NRS-133) TaxID=590998 RepID=F4H2G3_CELFA|nr:EcsC family protein [Cellulomonas fimi]AEE47583.1 hypothetical protein Celf_3471 [Cellulomonas fimi ATCC 484]NNH08803.1 EcsC family protein [Cellulomonas fimi]VEH36582.1 EcsC protein family [Cellulomonas fimi]
MSAEPSSYEAQQWKRLQDAHPSPTTRVAQWASDGGARAWGAARTAGRAISANPVASRVGTGVVRTASAVREVIPDAAASVVQRAGSQAAAAAATAAQGAHRALTRASSSTLQPSRVVAAHQKAGHPVASLSDITALDLELVDKVRPARLDIAYASVAAAVGGTTGLAITGAEVATTVTAGTSAGVVLGATAADAAAVIALCGRSVAHVGLYYGYDPSAPEEKLFASAIVNLGTAGSQVAKQVAWGDISTLTQLLMRGATWSQLNTTATSRILGEVTKRLGVRLTKPALARYLPFVAVAAGISFNWMALEPVVDAANLAYRRRFLLEKYPHLAADDRIPFSRSQDDADEGDDDPVSVVELLRESGALDEGADRADPDRDLDDVDDLTPR